MEIIGEIPGLKVQGNSLLYYPVVRSPVFEVHYPGSGTIYRYTSKKYVDAFFTSGKIRLNQLQSYRDTPDNVRADSQEGIGKFAIGPDGIYRDKTGLTIKVTNPNKKLDRTKPIEINFSVHGLVLCTSFTKSEKLKMKFGGRWICN